MNKQQRLKQLIAALALAGFFAPVHAVAQDDAEARTQAATLATEAITAKESGDLTTAKAKLEQVLKLNPSDDSAKALLTEVDKALLAKAEPAAPAKPLTALDRAAEENLNLFREVDSAMLEAQGLASRGDFDGAIALLDQAASALPANTAGQAQKDRVTLLRQQIIASRDSRDAGGVKRIAAEAISNEVRVSRDRVSDARRLISRANGDISARHFDDANAALDKAAALLPINSTADTARVEIKKTRSKLLEARYAAAIDACDMKAAEQAVANYEVLNGKNDSRAESLRSDLTEKQADPHFKGIADVSPQFAAREKKANELLAKGRAQYLYGDYLGALETYKDVLQYQPYNTEAKSFSIKIREILHEKSGRYNADVTKNKLLEEVDMKWATSEAFNKDSGVEKPPESVDPVITRMKGISIPSANLKEMKLDRVIETLGELSLSYDKDQKGVNFVLIDPEHKNPDVSLSLRDMSLDRVLEQVLRSVNFSYSVNNGVVEIRPDSGNSEAETEFFPLSKQSLARMTGIGAAVSGGGKDSPFGGGGAGADAGGTPEVDGLKRYFRSAGIDFSEETAKGTGIGYDGIQLIVTHNRRTLERIRNIVRRYSDVKQVAIEAKFIEVTQGTLNEIAANWTVVNHGLDGDRLTSATGNRTLDSAFRTSSGGSSGAIIQGGQPAYTTIVNNLSQTVDAVPPQKIADIPNAAPTTPGAANFGSSNTIGAFGGLPNSPGSANGGFVGTLGSTFNLGGYDVSLFIQALEQTTGSDLMAAPSITVASGTTATIKIAQLLRYPESYSQIQSQVSSSNGGNNNNGGGGGGSVSITAGTPQDFVDKEVGVVMEVVPTVSESGDSIDLDLKPKITEFEGFVEYGGTSVAVSSGTVVTVPSGFYQPIFSIREVVTKVTVYDGATVVIGGLTREEVKTVHDKVPVLGDMPLIGKLFQSNGKTSTKKNLMIFVTANMISPTGSMLRSSVGGVRNGTTFQNPTVASPSGPLYRSPVEAKSDK